MTVNGLSVVVPTLGRLDLVEKLLYSCEAAQKRFNRPVEIIIVDSSAPSAADRIRALCVEHGARYAVGPERVGTKRNVGVRLARYDVVLFIDSDCAATPELFVEHARCYETATPEVVVGVAGVTQMAGESGLLWRILGRCRTLSTSFSWPRYFSKMYWGTTSNFSVRRSAFLNAGGFDEQSWPIVGGEDVDLGIRMREAGGQILGRDTAIVRHARSHITNPFQVAHKLIRYGLADTWLCWKFPEQTRFRVNPVLLVFAMIFLSASTSLLTANWAVLVIGMPAAVLLVLAGTFLSRLRRLSGPDRHLEPFAIIIDWALEFGIVLGAVRRGRPQLALRGFNFYNPDKFELRPGLDRLPDSAFYHYGTIADGGDDQTMSTGPTKSAEDAVRAGGESTLH